MTLGSTLERDRLEARAARLDRVIVALRARARAYDATAVPRPLRHSLTDFQRERDAVRERLDTQVTPWVADPALLTMDRATRPGGAPGDEAPASSGHFSEGNDIP
jgi:hypothetical protein